MSITITNTETDLYTAIRTWLLGTILPSPWEVIQGQQNLAVLPVNPCVVMTSAGYNRLATNIDVLDVTGLISNINVQYEYKIQLDFYGAGSSEYSAIVAGMMRDQDTPALLPAYCQPLFADDPMQIPLITGGSSYLERWKVLAHFQFNPTLANATQSANVVVNSAAIPVDIFYH